MKGILGGILGWAKDHPTQASAIGVIILGWFSFILPAAIIGGLGSILGITLGTLVHNAVTPVTTAAANITEAATAAATETAKALGQTTVGTVGEVGATAQAVVEDVLRTVVPPILGKGT